jgi:hypothetical protein
MIEHLAIEVLAGLIAAGVAAIAGFVTGRLFQAQKYKAKHKIAISTFSRNLGEAIAGPNSDVLPKARTIVAIRDSSRNELTNVAHLLNSEIDKLKTLLDEADNFSRIGERIPAHIISQLGETINVLRGTWPYKRDQIDVAVRKLLAELGLVET